MTSSELDNLLEAVLKDYGQVMRRHIFGEVMENDGASLRDMARRLRAVMDHTEQGAKFDKAHGILDAIGVILRKDFADQCVLEYSNGQYLRTCPVDLAHIRAGLSPGFIIRSAECSICQKDPRFCPHIRGEVYNGETCIRIIKEADLLEVSLVDIPAQPEARIQSVGVPTASLGLTSEHLKKPPNITCDKCIKGCRGLSYPARNERQ